MKADESLPEVTTSRSSKYLNNLIEQDRRNIKSRANATRLQTFQECGHYAGIAMMRRIRKGQFALTTVLRPPPKFAPEPLSSDRS
ncbi:hypothetical protein [Paraburkholderia kirstenboschensis]|uniref:hypothetical protein n=1 Tax=Paraburkholderia kirstenboschensis TaxID=1245436 RepID=UPI0039A6F89B